MLEIQVRLRPKAQPTVNVWRPFARVPQRGELIRADNDLYVVVNVEWQHDGTPFVVAHALDRARSLEARRDVH